MVYAMSDLHGCYDKYCAMLEKINLQPEDTLYVLGDVLDRGPEPVRILMDLCKRKNAVLLLGNHELMALKSLPAILEDRREGYDTDAAVHWRMNGGDTTIAAFFRLPQEDRRVLLEYLQSLPSHKTVVVGENTFVLVHAGLPPCKSLADVEKRSTYDLCWHRPDYDTPVFEDERCYVVFGHTPTLLYHFKPEIVIRSRNIGIDCGAVFDRGKLACLRLDDLRVYYV